MSQDDRRPLIGLAMGDPSGISPELTAKIMADSAVRAAADLLVMGDRRVLEAGARVAGVSLDCVVFQPGQPLPQTNGAPVLLDLGHLDPDQIESGHASKAGGAFALANFRLALQCGARGVVDGVSFTPFNKYAMRLALPSYDDEIAVITEETGATANGREFNILEGLWNARISSHVPLKDAAAFVTKDRIIAGVRLTDACMRKAGFEKPRIAVAGLNPHAGDGGNFGREEIDEIEPAVAALKAEGIAVDGPYPADTVFVRARRGDFDAVQTMYHDQGQIAMKLIGFDKGVTLLAGYDFPITTPAHGTAYDIAGKGIANLGATRNALLIGAQMAAVENAHRPARSRADRAALLADLLSAARSVPA